MTKKTEMPAFFESFNAKYLNAEEVAKNFIYSKHFEELSGGYHAVLIGPRGSGKTTLLKMLQPSALSAWQGEKAEYFKEKINYSGVFISSDISWSEQLSALGYGKLSADSHEKLALACFTTHVIHAVLATMISRISGDTNYRSISMGRETEQNLAISLAEVIRLKPDLPSLLSLKQTLRNRLTDIRILANKASMCGEEECRALILENDYLHLDFLDVVSNITNLFNEAVGERNENWALLFDELETAPEWIVTQLFSAFRVSDPRLFLKLAISPVSSSAAKTIMSAAGPSGAHDHKQIKLWYTDKVESKAFCNSLWRSLCSKHGIHVDPYDALGASAFDPRPEGGLSPKFNPYAEGEYWHRLFIRLAAKDKSFAAFLRAKNIDLAKLHDLSQKNKDNTLRKAAPIAAVRDYYLYESEGGKVFAKDRKTSALYAGADSIFSITEGNPRWFIGLVAPLVNYMVRNGTKKVPVHIQSEEIDNTADRLIALLKTIPMPGVTASGEPQGLDLLLRKIGEKMHNDIVEKNFRIDPRLSFIVDKGVPERIRKMLVAAINRGAVMLVDEAEDKAIVGDMLGISLRLSYLLAARYGLPLRKGRSTNLQYLLGEDVTDLKNDSQLSLDVK